MRNVSIVGIGQIPVQKQNPLSIRQMGAQAVALAMADAGVDRVDGVFAGNMLADELQGQKHIATLIASEVGLRGVEALQVRAATATGAAALRMAYFAVASGEADVAVAVGVEKMSQDTPTPALAKALDAEQEVPTGATLLSQNARLMAMYLQQYGVTVQDFNNFPLNAHRNCRHNEFALFKNKSVTEETINASRVIEAPMRLFDCSPICDGAAAVVLAPRREARAYTDYPVHILASSVVIDTMRIVDRAKPLDLFAARESARKAFHKANLNPADVDFFELHDAFSIVACLLLEALGFAAPGQGWRLAANNDIGIEGKLPISTMGGLKARGHPIGATALYQTCEIVLQLTGRAGGVQVKDAHMGLLQSVGGVGTTVLTHIFAGE